MSVPSLFAQLSCASGKSVLQLLDPSKLKVMILVCRLDTLRSANIIIVALSQDSVLSEHFVYPNLGLVNQENYLWFAAATQPSPSWRGVCSWVEALGRAAQ